MSTIKLRVVEVEAKFGYFQAKCAEVTEFDLVGRLVYAKFTVQKDINFEFEVPLKRINKVVTKKKRTILVLN